MEAGLLAVIVVVIGLALFVWWLLVLIEALRTPRSQWDAAGQNQVDEGSMLVASDKALRLKATLPWPKRNNGDHPIGWISDDTYLLTYGRTMAVWSPTTSTICRVSAVPTDLVISMAMEVVDAECT